MKMKGCHSEPEHRGGEESHSTCDSTRDSSARGLRMTALHNQWTDYGGLQLYEEVILGFPLPVWERDRVRGKVAAKDLLVQPKSTGIAIV
jgi:hypothetical protein